MKRIQIVSILCLALLIVGISVHGQEPATKEKNPSTDQKKPSDADKKKTQEPMTKIKGYLPPNWKQIGLTDDQKQEIYKRQAYHRSKVKMLEAEIEKIKADERTDIEAVLTELQKKRLREILLDKAPKPE